MNLAANVGRFELYSDSPRMVPLGLTPTPLEVEMTQSVSFVRDPDRKRRPGGIVCLPLSTCLVFLVSRWHRRRETGLLRLRRLPDGERNGRMGSTIQN